MRRAILAIALVDFEQIMHSACDQNIPYFVCRRSSPFGAGADEMNLISGRHDRAPAGSTVVEVLYLATGRNRQYTNGFNSFHFIPHIIYRTHSDYVMASVVPEPIPDLP